jgi:hypothetical protein
MSTLKYRCLRGDMIETFKIITDIYDNEITELSMSCCLYGDQTAAAYSRCGLTNIWSYAHLGRWMFFWWGPLCCLPYLFSAVYVVNNLIGHQLRHPKSFSPSECCSSTSLPSLSYRWYFCSLLFPLLLDTVITLHLFGWNLSSHLSDP